MNMKNLRQIFGLILIVGLLLSCSKDTIRNESSRLKISLTDAPGIFEEVNIDIVGVKIILNDSLVELNAQTGIYNLLDFVNGHDTVLVDEEIPNGKLSQIRLILGYNNSVKVDSIVYNLKTPSAQQSGLKLNVHKEFFSGIIYTYVIDFDAGKSVVNTGNDKYILKPVIRVFSEAITGAIQGVVQPVEANPLIYAISTTDDTSSTFSDTLSGKFMFRGLNEGTYRLEFMPDNSYNDTTLYDVEVLTGNVTVIDTLYLQ